MREWNPFKLTQWITWLSAILVAAVGLTSFLFVNFTTKASFDEAKQEKERFDEQLIKRLDRIEDKLDQLIQN